MIKDEQLNDSLANFQSFRFKIDLGNRRANITRLYFEICARNNDWIMSTVFKCEILVPSRRPIFLLLLSILFILCIRFRTYSARTQHDTRRTITKQSPKSQQTTELCFLFTRKNAMHNSHWSGSTRMGDDQESVVDSKLRVNGVENLRVIDAGVMPYIPNGNTHSTTCVIALRAVDLILNER